MPSSPPLQAALAYLHRAMVPSRFADSLVDLVACEAALPAAERLIDGRILRKFSPPYPNLGRNELVRAFLELPREVDRLVFVDDDNTWEPWQLRALCELATPERPVVSALYFAYDDQRGNPRPILLRRTPGGGMGTTWTWDGGLMEVDVVGMGCCAIHRSVLEAQRGCWFDYATGPGGEFLIEDRAFCERVQQLGKPIFVHTGIESGHCKLATIGSRQYRLPAG